MIALVTSRRFVLVIALLFGGVFPILGGVILSRYVPDLHWHSRVFHSVVEGFGAFAAVIVAIIILIMRSAGKGLPSYCWLAYGFLGMGLLDGFHAAVDEGQAFVWLHTAATLVGGLFIALVWLPERLAPKDSFGVFFIATLIGATALGVYSSAAPDSLPAMLEDGRFTATAHTLNIVGGIGFIAGAAFFAFNPDRSSSLENLVFATQALFLGTAGILFDFSELWDGPWWLWHFVRLSAFLIAVAYFLYIFARSQLELQEREAQYRSVTESSTVAMIITVDEDGKIVSWNPAAEKNFGYGENEIIGLPLTELMPERYREGHTRGFERAVRTETFTIVGSTVDLHGLRKSGEEFPLQLSLGTWKQHGKRYFSAVLHDVTEDVAAKRKLEATHQRMTLAADSAGIGIWERDLVTRELVWDSWMYRLYGVERRDGESASDAWRRGVHPDDLERVDSAADRATRGEAEFDTSFRIVRPDGETRHIKAHAVTVRDDDGTPVRMTGVNFDITESVRAERAIHDARSVAEKANAAKSEFLASMSHELRTPLNAVLGFAQFLKNDPRNILTNDQREHVDNILDAGHHLLELVNEVLDLAKIEADQLAFKIEEIDGRAVIGDCVALSMPLGEPRGITIANRVGDGPPILLLTDAVRLKQALLNLLSNAVKYNEANGRVTIEADETEDGFLRISVVDTGIGIAEEDRPCVFQMFHRIGVGSMVAAEGTGIGLTVTKLLVERMAGRIGFESEPGKGSRFWVELPLASNRDVLIWSEAFRVGVDAIDKDHQTIISLFNKVSLNPVEDADPNDLLHQLIDYTDYHFRREEMIMEVCGYPRLEAHREKHRKLSREVRKLATECRAGSADLKDIRKFLRRWLIDHIGKDDRDIAGHAKGRDQEIREALRAID